MGRSIKKPPDFIKGVHTNEDFGNSSAGDDAVVDDEDLGEKFGSGDEPPVPPSSPSDPKASDRKFRAKRINEHIKSLYGLANTLAAAIIGTAYILPTIKNECGPNELDRPGWVLIGLTLHVFGQIVIWRGTQKEE